MKILFLTFLMSLTLNAFSNDGYNKCTETIQVVAKQIQSIQQRQQQSHQEQQRHEGLCNGSPDIMCGIIDVVAYEKVQILEQTMQQIQQFCAGNYGQQQQQQYSPQQQQPTSQFQQVHIELDQIVNTGFNVLVLCDGQTIRHLKEIITTGNCVLPNGQAYQQPQSGACSYRSVYLEKGQNFTIAQQTYFCE
jgi:hypothetical protein